MNGSINAAMANMSRGRVAFLQEDGERIRREMALDVEHQRKAKRQSDRLQAQAHAWGHHAQKPSKACATCAGVR
jgi:CRISPR/Cas system type I-B associated protein Csh2 (Cas7 group RAMP superfamily)